MSPQSRSLLLWGQLLIKKILICFQWTGPQKFNFLGPVPEKQKQKYFFAVLSVSGHFEQFIFFREKNISKKFSSS